MTLLTQKERDALANLPQLAATAMRSRPTLKLLGRMQDKGLIEFHPFEGRAHITGLGHKLLGDITTPEAIMAITIDALELLALKKLAVISGALAASLKDQRAMREQRALTSVLVDVCTRAELDNEKAKIDASCR